MRGSLYLLHLSPPYKHAAHYLGFSKDVPARIEQHMSSGPKASPLIRAALAAGCAVEVVRVWPGTRTEERRIKTMGHVAAWCPTCRPRYLAQRKRRREAARV